MGGAAFASGDRPLHTPRMPRPVYHDVKSRCMAILRQTYVCVASPIDGPGKTDFGDIDILVAWPKDFNVDGSLQDTRRGLDAIADALGAARIIVNDACASNLALPWPRRLLKDEESAAAADENMPDDRYIQVDVRICRSLQEMQWMLFKHAHGDIWNILGSTTRPYGLTVDDGALWLRVPEIEKTNRNRAKVLLTSEPARVLAFLGLPVVDYWDRPFESLDAMFEYAARCRMMYVPPPDDDPSAAAAAATSSITRIQDGGTEQQQQQQAAAEDRKKLKANDRRRMRGRPAFRAWVDAFLPACRRAGRFAAPQTTRERVTEEALRAFPHARDDFAARRDDFLRERQRETIWNVLIKGAVPEPDRATATGAEVTYRACLVKALKRVILEGDESYDDVIRRRDEGREEDEEERESLRDERGFWRLDRVVDFIERHKDCVGEMAYARQNERYMEHLKAKEAKAKAAGGGQ
ncbi:hypothetical protein JDV02_005486 [Purpureocillium takamizusanense]|uniref:Nucleotidyltransferase n=1 Tax=Purpureocillium takamizusanense TaxID=2060973 RepID=A0A9Q8VBY8_9HYPO|nr:uncharacterized protein JDV02_005486 [Purpureocillium takamizusanense]UNI19292.1 hypothetical protein JDV02_005486 [Purpureocillium takamizusanense]